jgi:hypothetical protein
VAIAGQQVLHPSLLLLQRQFEGLHVGGKSALDWYGVRQYVSQQPAAAPVWLEGGALCRSGLPNAFRPNTTVSSRNC